MELDQEEAKVTVGITGQALKAELTGFFFFYILSGSLANDPTLGDC